MNKVWIRIRPILGLLLLLSVCSLLSDSKYQENSDSSYFKQAKCISGSSSFPEGDGGLLNADLNRWFEGKGKGQNAKSANCGKCQEKGNSFKFSKSLSSFSSTKNVFGFGFSFSLSSNFGSMFRDFTE